MNESSDKPTVFISYSHKDEAWKDRLHPHLVTLVKQAHVILWDDRKIGTGDDWYPEIQSAMAHAAVAVCLISADFLASDFVMKEEIPFLLERRREHGMLLLPILLSPCPWQAVEWLRNIQIFPDPEKPLETMSTVEQKQAFADIAVEIYKKISDAEYELPTSSPAWAELAKDHIDIDRLPRTGTEIFGRAEQLTLLDEAWDSETTHIVSFVAWGGVGKSALVNKWVEKLKEDNYRGAQRVYAWSFYSQGTHERVTAADMFIDKALRWFDDAAFADTNRSGWDKGQRLAEHIQKEKTLLLLDGFEPLQSGFEHDRGEVKDPALRVLIEELAKKNPGLCVITTREDLVGLDDFNDHIVQKNLEQISAEAGRALLRIREIRGTDEQLEQATHDFGNHALAVNLLAAYLHDMPGREIAHAALIPDLDIPDAEGRHPRRLMEAFAKKFDGQPELNVLNMMGLFDRPASAREVKWRRSMDTIPQVTDRIRWIDDEQWEQTLRNLRSARLLALPSHHDPDGLDAHPLVREHFGQRLLRNNEEAWKQAHSQFYDFLSKSAPRLPNTLEEMAPLFAAIAHGCKAGRHEEAFEVYYSRVQRDGNIDFCRKMLGAVGQGLAALSPFFESPWNSVVKALGADKEGCVLGAAGMYLRSLGRLHEAVETMKAALKLRLTEDFWRNAAIQAGNLSETVLLLGDVSQALDYARQGVELADKDDDPSELGTCRSLLGDALFQAGRLREAQILFRESEQLQKEEQPEYPVLYSLPGYHYCQLLLDLGNYHEARKRAFKTLAWAKKYKFLHDIAHDHLTVGQACLMAEKHEGSPRFAEAEDHLRQALDGFRKAEAQEYLPRVFLVRAEYFRVRGKRDGGDFLDLARQDVDDAMTIAKRCKMRLDECDCHLEYARLHLAKGEKAQADEHFKTARAMVHEMGYHRRDKDLAEIEAQL